VKKDDDCRRNNKSASDRLSGLVAAIVLRRIDNFSFEQRTARWQLTFREGLRAKTPSFALYIARAASLIR
jgi:hypothetical protein